MENTAYIAEDRKAFLREERDMFLRECVTQGLFPQDVSDACHQRWLERLHKVPGPILRPGPRLVNHFKVGADPEFVMTDAFGDTRLDATALSLRTGLAFGADQNGRLVEIRPKPSRFALEVLASTLTSLRWMALLRPTARRYEWRAGAYILRDGLGGHVHLGRKSGAIRKSEKFLKEVQSLDTVYALLMNTGTYPKADCQRRMKGDQFGQLYGQPGDTRPQAHGYEYRAFPSWLDSPWMAYLTLVVSKLCVHSPMPLQQTAVRGVQSIRNLLALYQGVDDDARIAYQALEKLGMPKFNGGDFKPRWGLNYTESAKIEEPQLFPSSITPSEDEMCEVFHHLTKGAPLRAETPKPNWNTTLPKGYYQLITTTETMRVAGLGEVLSDIVGHEGRTLLVQGGDVIGIAVSSGLRRILPPKWKEQFRALGVEGTNWNNEGFGIRLSAHSRRPENVSRTRKALTCGLFPLWRALDVKEDSFEKWSAGRKAQEPKGKVLLKVGYKEVG